MKYILIFLLFMFSSCVNEKPKTDVKVRTEIVHSIDKEKIQIDTITKAKAVEIPEFDFKDSTFKSFYSKFKRDSAFQIERIKFPLKGKYQTYDEEHEWTMEKWPYMFWDFRIENLDDSVSIVQDNNKFFYGTYCKDCGFSFEMQFNKIKGIWFLTYRQENNY